MKLEQVNKKEETFEPIEIKLTIESKEELAELWARLNASLNAIEAHSHEYEWIDLGRTTSLFGLWDLLDEIAIGRGIK